MLLFVNTTTERALERAEALRFSRMLVARNSEDNQTYRFFFSTNRQSNDHDTLLDSFANQISEELTFGYFDTSVEPSLGIGMLINPTDWFQNEEIKLKRVKTLDQQSFVHELRKQVEASPHKGLLLVINGFRERFPSALRKTAFVSHILDIDAPVLVFDWPGDQGSSPAGYRRAQSVARESGVQLSRLVMTLTEEVQPERTWLLANSMGGEVVVSAFTNLYQDETFRDSQAEFEDVVLTAPDVSHQQFGAQFADEISALTKNLSVYVSSNDRALLMSRLINRESRLGESTLNPNSPDLLSAAQRTMELVHPDNEQVSLIDVTPINRTRNFHNFSLETPEFFDDLYLRLINPETPKSRIQHRLTTPAGKHYWILVPSR